MFPSNERRKSRRVFLYLFGFAFTLLLIGRSSVPLPIAFTTAFVPFELSEPAHLPFEATETYANVIQLNQARLIYKNDAEQLTVWATTDLGWNHVATWDEHVTLADGSDAYFHKIDDTQIVSWQMGNVEYAIDYKGDLTKDELVQIANSIQ
ncbi:MULTISPECIES: DUF4367 domain-containing protein [Exiguobacterium]|uniref:DUF4367 domain-containing protein n=1 Tax=Exiguobacterium TaxID=33986 RepID=UPI001BECAA32|nr:MULTISPECIES: DUF4367 domain-containing protein [Exiguobacterium]MCT4784217.1 DUF4367 domain-containing protein [Exiguobacterium himgiriensis]